MDISQWLRQTAENADSDIDLQQGADTRDQQSSQQPIAARSIAHRQDRRKRRAHLHSDSSLLPDPNVAQPADLLVKPKTTQFERRARHKTRPDLYDPKPGKRVDKKKGAKRATQAKNKKPRRGDNQGEDSASNDFQLPTIPKDGRLTLRASHVAGIFRHGRASHQASRRVDGLPDLTFNEMTFLQRPRRPSVVDIQHVQGDQQNDQVSSYFKDANALVQSPEHQRPAAELREPDQVRTVGPPPTTHFLHDQAKSHLTLSSNSKYTWSESAHIPSDPPPAETAIETDRAHEGHSTSASLPHGRTSTPDLPKTVQQYHTATHRDPEIDVPNLPWLGQTADEQLGEVIASNLQPCRRRQNHGSTDDLFRRIRQVNDVSANTGNDGMSYCINDDDDVVVNPPGQDAEAMRTITAPHEHRRRITARRATPDLLGPEKHHIHLWDEESHDLAHDMNRSMQQHCRPELNDMDYAAYEYYETLDSGDFQDSPSEVLGPTEHCPTQPQESFLGRPHHEDVGPWFAPHLNNHWIEQPARTACFQAHMLDTTPNLLNEEQVEETPLCNFWKPHKLY